MLRLAFAVLLVTTVAAHAQQNRPTTFFNGPNGMTTFVPTGNGNYMVQQQPGMRLTPMPQEPGHAPALQQPMFQQRGPLGFAPLSVFD